MTTTTTSTTNATATTNPSPGGEPPAADAVGPADQAPLVDPDGTLSPAFGFLGVHRGLRRDAARLREVSGRWRADPPTAAERGGLLRHWALYREVLEVHHRAEDDRLFPMVLSAEPALGPLFDELAAEHEALAELLPRIEEALHAVALDAPDGGGAATAALGELEELLERHLGTEEREVVPVMVPLYRAMGTPPGPPPGQAPSGGAMAPSFANAFIADGLEPGVLALALERLPEHHRVAFPGWFRDYEDHLATWWPGPRS